MAEPLTTEETVRRVLAEAVWAPSVHNTQPWRFAAAGPEISLHADDSWRLPVSDPDGREMMISCGAALFTARLALRSLGWIRRRPCCRIPARPLLVARVRWQRREPPAGFEQRLFGQVRQRGRTAAGLTRCRCRRTCWPCCGRAP
jgi:nitroreductase